MKFTRERAYTAGMVLVLALILGLGGFAWRSTAKLAEQGGALQRAQRVLTLLAALQAALTDAETGQRGFTITGEAVYLDGQRPARELVDAHMAELRTLVAGNAEQYVRLVALGPLLTRRFDALAASIEVRRRAGAGPAQAFEAAGDGRRLHDRVRGAVAELQRSAEAELAAAWGRSSAATSLAQGLIAAGTGLAVAVAGLAMWLLRRKAQALQRTLAARSDGQQRHSHAEQDLARIFEGLPEALCLLDAEGRLVRCSLACEPVLGWSRDALKDSALVDKVQPEDRRRAEKALAAAMAGQPVRDLRTRWRCQDGNVIQLQWAAQWSPEAATLLCTARDVTELERLRDQATRMAQALRQGSAELAQVSARVETLGQLQADFLSTVEREMRTPVAALAGGLEMLLQDAGPALAGEHRRTTAALRDRARAMQEAINDLLDLSAIEAGQLRLQNEAFDLAEALNEVAAAVRPLADKKGLALQLQLAEDLGYARGDPRRVTQVLTKLLRHAIQGTERGSVSLRAARQGSTVVCMQVADTGRGMGADEVAQLFSPWRAADAAPGEGASHLKLAVSQRLAQLMGGDIGVTSQPEQGSTYTLTLPADNVVHA